MMEAVRSGDIETVTSLLEGTDINMQNEEDGMTALISASINGKRDIVELLLKAGADPNIKDALGQTALMGAQGNIDILRLLLLDKGVNPNIQDRRGNTALMIATVQRNTDVVKLLLDKGVDPNIVDTDGKTALIISAATVPFSRQENDDNLKNVRLLLDKGADPNIVDNDGKTALMHATYYGNIAIVEIITAKLLSSANKRLTVAKSMLSVNEDSPLQNLDTDTMEMMAKMVAKAKKRKKKRKKTRKSKERKSKKRKSKTRRRRR